MERFAVIGSGEAECKSCQYVYEPKNGDENYPVAKGTRFENLPPDWRCPVCGAEKKMFESRSKVVAGFRQNQGAHRLALLAGGQTRRPLHACASG